MPFGQAGGIFWCFYFIPWKIFQGKEYLFQPCLLNSKTLNVFQRNIQETCLQIWHSKNGATTMFEDLDIGTIRYQPEESHMPLWPADACTPPASSPTRWPCSSHPMAESCGHYHVFGIQKTKYIYSGNCRIHGNWIIIFFPINQIKIYYIFMFLNIY